MILTAPQLSAPKTSLAANARRNNEKALNILLSAIPDRHLLSFHDAVDARSLWKAILIKQLWLHDSGTTGLDELDLMISTTTLKGLLDLEYQAVLSRSTDGSYYPRMDSRRPRISSYSPSSRGNPEDVSWTMLSLTASLLVVGGYVAFGMILMVEESSGKLEPLRHHALVLGN
ncbi:hypothetical protein Tco_0576162 [Tanacetum coccineum]